MIEFLIAEHGADHVRGADRLPAVRLSRSRSRSAACGLFFGFVGIELGLLPPTLLQALPLRIFGIMQNDTLLAIPFFTFMGLILERSGMAEDLLDTIGQLFGPIRGGLGLRGDLRRRDARGDHRRRRRVGDLDGPDLAADHAALRLRPARSPRGVIAASGTLAQIIPPSLVLIVLADQLGRSVGDLYKGAFIPGFVLTGLYLGYVLIVSLVAAELGAGAAARGAHDPRGRRHARACARSACSLVAVGRRGDRLRASTRPATTRRPTS